MEKQSNPNGTARRKGLLIRLAALCILAFPAYAQQNERGLSVRPASPQFYAGRPIAYTLAIPNVRPAQVTPVLSVLPPGIALVSMRKEGRQEPGGPVTFILFEFAAAVSGPVSLPSLAVSIDGGAPFLVPFESSMVIEDPLRARPFFMLLPDQAGPAEVGRPCYFTLYARNTAAVTGLSLDLRKDAVFSVAERFAALESGAGLENSLNREIPLARLEWLPLESGELNLPGVHLGATSFAGVAAAVTLPETVVSVRLQAGLSAQAASPSGNAFASMPYPSAFDRTTLPVTEGIPAFWEDPAAAVQAAVEREGRVFRRAFWLCAALSAAFILLAAALIALARFRKFRFLVPLSVLLVILGAAAIYFSAPLWRAGGIYAGGQIKAVPEDSASPVENLPPGTRVTVLKRSESWYYVAQDQVTGWVPAGAVYLLFPSNPLCKSAF
jgi:hypothetical protein